MTASDSVHDDESPKVSIADEDIIDAESAEQLPPRRVPSSETPVESETIDAEAIAEPTAPPAPVAKTTNEPDEVAGESRSTDSHSEPADAIFITEESAAEPEITFLDVPPKQEGEPIPPPVRVYDNEPPATIVPSDERGFVRKTWDGFWWVFEWCFGALSLYVGLALLATLPIIQFLSLGYLLECSARVSRSGRLRDGFVGVRKAARVGSLVVGTWLWMLPLRLLADMWYTSNVIDAGSSVAAGWRVVLIIFGVLIISHILWAWYRGGRLRHFLWPAPILFVKRMIRGGKYAEARDAVWDFVVSLHLPHYFSLGVRGFAGAMAWLAIPVFLFIGATELPGGFAVVSGFLGSISLAAVLVPLPFLQAQFAAENRLSCMFDLWGVTMQFLRTPISFFFALFITLLFALPLYLLKVQLLPQEVLLLPSLVFVAFIFPARLLTGWAVGRARKAKELKTTWLRAIGWFTVPLLTIPAVGFYVFVVFFTRYTSWSGVWSTFEQHAFMVPVPFLGM